MAQSARDRAIMASIKKHQQTIKLIDKQKKDRIKFLKGHGTGEIPISVTVNFARARTKETNEIKRLKKAKRLDE